VNAHMLSQTAPIDLEAVSGALYRHQRRGRRFSANCVVLRGSDLRLSNDMRLEELPVEITIFETARMKDQLAKLPQGALGSFHFHEAIRPHADIPGLDPFLSGWFVLNANSLEDAWNQVQHGGYTECTLTVEVGPIESPGIGWLWDVAKSPHLVIETVSVDFTRPAPKLDQPVEKKRSSLWRR
jgi:hypothetical protein